MTEQPVTQKKAKASDTRNRKAMVIALLPLLVSVLAAGLWFYSQSLATTDRTYKIGVERKGSDNYDLLEALSRQATDRDGKTIKLEIAEVEEAGETIRLLQEGQIDFASLPADAISRPNLSMVAVLYADTYHLIARRDAGIKTVPDLFGKRIGLPILNSSEYRSFWYVIDQYTVQPEKFTAITLPTEMAFQALRAKDIDATFVVRAPGNRRLKWLADAVQIDIIEIDQAAAMSIKRPALRPTTLAKGTYSGTPALPADDIATVATDRLLVTRPDVPEEIVNQITATLFENQRELSQFSRLAGFVQQPQLDKASLLPIHPGALSFYTRDEPSFFQENAEPIGVTVSVTAILISLLLWMKRRWEEGQKGRVDVYNLDLLRITEDVRKTTSPEELEQHKSEIFAMLDQVVNDLDKDKIDGKGFQYFAFTWKVALDAIITRKAELEGQ